MLAILGAAALCAGANAQATAPAYTFITTPLTGITTATVTFTFSGSTTISSVFVLTQGTAGLDYTRNASSPGTCTTTTYAASATCTVGVQFAPRAPGFRNGAVALVASTGSVYYGLLGGTGTGPEAALYPGTQTTVVPSSGFTGDAYGITVDANANIYLANSAAGSIAKYTYSGGTYTASAIGSGLSNTPGLAVDGAGNIFYADESSRRIVEEVYNPATNTYTQSVVIGTTNIPTSLAIDGSGTLYIGVGPTLQYLTANGSGGFNSAVTIDNTINTFNGIAVDASGNVYVNDSGTGYVYKEAYSGGTYTRSTIASGLSNNNGIAVDAAGIVYVSAQGTSTSILRYAPSGGSYTQLASVGSFARNNGVAVDGAGNLYVTDDGSSQNSVAKINVSGTQTLAAGNTYTTGKNYLSGTLVNTGNRNLTFTIPNSGFVNPTVSGSYFSYDSSSTCPEMTSASTATVLSPAGYCTVVAAYQPTTATPSTGTLAVQDNSVNQFATQNETLTGTGATPSTTLSMSESVSGTQVYGVSQTLSATVNPTSSSGTVIFYANGVAITSAITPTSGVATYTYTPNAGSYSYVAIFTGTGGSTSSNITTLTVTQAAQTITFTQPTTPAYVGTRATLSASSTSGGAVTFSLLSGPATLAGSVVSYTGTGTVVIAANQAGNGNYTAAPQVTRSVTVNAAPTYIVTTTTDSNPGTAGNCTDQNLPGATLDASCALHDAFTAVNNLAITGSYPGVTVQFAPALYGQSFPVSTTIGLSGNVNLVGPGSSVPANVVSITPAAAGIGFLISTTANLNVTISGLTVKNFSGTSTTVLLNFTGSGGSLTLSNDNFTNNVAVTSGAVLEISSSPVTITSSTFSGNRSTSGSGGALEVSAAALTVSNSVFNGNAGGNGGAIYLTGTLASATISGSSFGFVGTGGPNTARTSGGVIYSTGSALSITNSTFLANTAVTSGGAIYQSSTKPTTISNSTFGGAATGAGNSANYAGAMYLSAGAGSTPSMTYNNFLYNKGTAGTTVGGGGAVFLTGPANAAATVTLTGNNFIGNSQASTSSSGYGGALFSYRSSSKNNLLLLNNLFENNTASSASASQNSLGGAIYASQPVTGYPVTGEIFAGNTFTGNQATGSGGGTVAGGGMYLFDSYVTASIVNNTIVANTATGGTGSRLAGGMYLSGASSSVTFYNNIVANNTAGSSNPDFLISGTVNSQCATFCNAGAGINPTINSGTTLSALANYGGPTVGATGTTLPTYTMLPLPGSTALAAGSTTYTGDSDQTCSGASTPVDARGCDYPRQIGALIDAGAAQANYSLLFMQQPQTTASGGSFSPPPSVQLYESGLAFTAASGSPATFAPGSGSPFTLSASTANFNASGIAALAAAPTSTATSGTYVGDNFLVASVQNSVGTVDASTESAAFAISDATAKTIRFVSGPPTESAQGAAVGTVKVGLYAAGSSTPDTSTSAYILLTIQAPDNSTNSYNVNAVQGVATFNVGETLGQTGTYTITAVSSYTNDTAEAFDTVSATSQFAGFTQTITASPLYPGTAYTLTLKAVDQNGAAYTAFTGPVSLTAGDSATTITPATYSFAAADAGVHSFTVTFGAAGTRTITATASGVDSTASYTVLDYIWLLNANGTVAKVSEAGAGVTGAVGMSTTASTLGGVAVDGSGNVWSVTAGSNALDFATKAGTGSASFTGGGLKAPAAVAIDGQGYVWVANSGSNTVSAFTAAGAASSGTVGYGSSSLATGATGVAIDATGGVWVTSGTGSSSSVTHLFGVAAPTQPLAQAVTNGTEGTRP